MTITPNSLAAINGVGVENQKFAVTAQVKPQKKMSSSVRMTRPYTRK